MLRLNPMYGEVNLILYAYGYWAVSKGLEPSMFILLSAAMELFVEGYSVIIWFNQRRMIRKHLDEEQRKVG